MSVGETPITVVGNLTADPEVKFTTNGAQMATFTVASTPRAYDKNTGQWRDGTAMFLRCTAWREMAEHVTDSLAKGVRVVVTGRLRQHDWTTPEGEKRSMLGLEVDDIGPSLRFATATVQRVTRTTPPPTAAGGAPSGDPWNTAAPARTASGGAAGGFGDEPPF